MAGLMSPSSNRSMVVQPTIGSDMGNQLIGFLFGVADGDDACCLSFGGLGTRQHDDNMLKLILRKLIQQTNLGCRGRYLGRYQLHTLATGRYGVLACQWEYQTPQPAQPDLRISGRISDRWLGQNAGAHRSSFCLRIGRSFKSREKDSSQSHPVNTLHMPIHIRKVQDRAN